MARLALMSRWREELIGDRRARFLQQGVEREQVLLVRGHVADCCEALSGSPRCPEVWHTRSTKGVLNFTHLGNGASSVLVWLVSQPIESEHATTTRAMSGAPVVVVDGTAVDGTHPASPSDWLKTLPQLGARTTGRTRGAARSGAGACTSPGSGRRSRR